MHHAFTPQRSAKYLNTARHATPQHARTLAPYTYSCTHAPAATQLALVGGTVVLLLLPPDTCMDYAQGCEGDTPNPNPS